MLHYIAFVVIGVVIGALYIRQSRGAAAIIRVIAGLVGSLIGGLVALDVMGSASTAGKYGSLLVAIVLAVILAALATAGTRPRSA